MPTLQEQILLVAEARRKVAGYKFAKDTLYHEWLQERGDLLADLDRAEIDCKAAEDALRSLTLQAYQETGSKAPAPGVTVRIFQTLDYDLDAAKDWALEHRLALKLDVPTFEKLAKAESLSFVKIIEEPRAQIAQNLDTNA